MYDLHFDIPEISPSSKISNSRLIEDRTKLNLESFSAFTLKAFTGFRSGLFSRRTVFTTD